MPIQQTKYPGYPKALHHPRHANSFDHKRVENPEEHKALIASDPAWREEPYTDAEHADFVAKESGGKAAKVEVADGKFPKRGK